MKINEIDKNHRLDEGPFDWLRGKVNAFQGAGDRNAVGKDLYKKWMQSVGMDPTLANNKQALQQFMQKAARNVPNVPLPTSMDPGDIQEYITTIAGQSLAGAMRNAPEAGSWAERHDAEIAARSGAVSPVGTKIPGLTVLAGHTNPDTEPLLDMNGKKYTIDSTTGNWVDETGRVLNDNLQRQFYAVMQSYAPDNKTANASRDKWEGKESPAPAQPTSQAAQQPAASTPGLSQAQQDYIAAIGTDDPAAQQNMDPALRQQIANVSARLNPDQASSSAPAAQTPAEIRQAKLKAAAQAADAYSAANPVQSTAQSPEDIRKAKQAAAASAANQTAQAPAAAPKTPEEIRAAKQAAAATAAQQSMASKPAAPNFGGPAGYSKTTMNAPVATVPSTSRAIPTAAPAAAPASTATPSTANVPATRTMMPTNMPAPTTKPATTAAATPAKQPRPGLAAAQRRAQQDAYMNKPVTQLESVDLGEVLWRKMKSKRR